MIEVFKIIGTILYLMFTSFCIGEAIGEYRAEERERKRRIEDESNNNHQPYRTRSAVQSKF